MRLKGKVSLKGWSVKALWVLLCGVLLFVAGAFLSAQSSGQLGCCQWKCYPTQGQASCEQLGGIGMCWWRQDIWGNWDECEHAPPTLSPPLPVPHRLKNATLDIYIGQCFVCCDSDGDGVPDTPIPSWKLNLWQQDKEYTCGLICRSEFTTEKAPPPQEPFPVPMPTCSPGVW